MSAAHLQVPAFVARHRSPLVKQAVDFATLVFANRNDLRTAKHDRWGNLVYDKLHLFLMRSAPRPALRKDGRPYQSPESLKGRRADHFQRMLSFWLTWLALADHETWELWEPDHEKAKVSPYPTMKRIAELAELNCSASTAERIRKAFANAGLLAKTVQFRPKRSDGAGFFSSGGALRRISAKVLATINGFFGRAIVEQLDETARARAKRKQEQKYFDDRVDEMHEGKRKLAAALAETRTAGEPSPLPLPPPSAEAAAIEAVESENPGWTFREVYREARRRLQLAGAALDPKPDTS